MPSLPTRWTPRTLPSGSRVSGAIATWTPRTLPQPRGTGRNSWTPRTLPVEPPLPGDIIIIARKDDFEMDGAGAPIRYLPLSRGMFGTVALSREVGWGTVISSTKSKRAPTGAEIDQIGLILSGFVGDQTDTFTVQCDVQMMDPDDEPETGDMFTAEGKLYCIYEVTIQGGNEDGKEMSVSGIRWKGCTVSHTPAPLTAPATWS